MKIYWLLAIVCLSGCQQQKDEALISWIKESWAIDMRVNRGMGVFGNGLMGMISYDGKSPAKAAQILAKADPKYKILGPVIDVHEYLIFPNNYCVHAEENGVDGYIVLMMILSKEHDSIRWDYRFYSKDFFVKMEQNAKKKNGA